MSRDYVLQISKDIEYIFNMFKKLRNVLTMFIDCEDFSIRIENNVLCLEKTVTNVSNGLKSIYEKLINLLQFMNLVPKNSTPVLNYVTIRVCNKESNHLIKGNYIEVGDVKLSIINDSSSITIQILHRDVINQVHVLTEFCLVKHSKTQ